METTYFGLKVHNNKYVLESDIKKLPFYDFWLESSVGSGVLILENNDVGIWIDDWKQFSELFIKDGKHRFQ